MPIRPILIPIYEELIKRFKREASCKENKKGVDVSDTYIDLVLKTTIFDRS